MPLKILVWNQLLHFYFSKMSNLGYKQHEIYVPVSIDVTNNTNNSSNSGQNSVHFKKRRVEQGQHMTFSEAAL